LTRAYNIREGMTRDDDKLPDRFFTPFPAGPMQGVKVDKAALQQAKEYYYAIAGWDGSGAPTPGKLQELGIDWVSAANR
jgi:aldehyde:ferredoxin oxidoreductase